MTLDIDFVRSQFPAFETPALSGGAFFENAGGSFPCRQVVDRLTRFYAERKVQPYGPFEPSRVGGEEMDEARTRLAALLGVGDDELTFGPSTTQNTYVLAEAFRQMLEPGDVVVVTEQDHEANTGFWRRLASSGIEVREWRVDPASGRLDPSTLVPLLDGARLLAFPHVSNIVGEINDAAAITALAHDAGAMVCIDGVSFAPHGLPDIAALGADIYLFSAYKTYGPHQGVMTIRRDLSETLPNQAHYFNADVAWKRFAPAGPDHAQVAASAGIADYIDTLHASFGPPATPPAERARTVTAAMRERETALLGPLLDFLAAREGIRLIGPTEAAGRAPTVSIHSQEPGAALARRLAQHGVWAAGGDFYAPRPLRAMGIDPAHGVLRLSFVHYTHEDEVSRLIEALDHVL